MFSVDLTALAMPRQKKSRLKSVQNLQKGKQAAQFKTPAVPVVRSGSSAASSSLSRHSLILEGDAAVRTRSQAKRATEAVAAVSLPEYQPIDVEAWTQQSLNASQEDVPVDLPGKLLIQ
jgi:hypothetical protein